MAPASYAMFWSIGSGPRRAGRIEVEGDHLSLAATSPAAAVVRVAFGDLARVLLDRSVLHLERSDGEEPVHIGSLDTPGALRELADRLSDAVRVSSP